MALWKRTLWCKSVGGALFMGFEKAILKSYGGSRCQGSFNAMELVYRMVDLDVVGRERRTSIMKILDFLQKENIPFKRISLYKEAFTHSSYANESNIHIPDYED